MKRERKFKNPRLAFDYGDLLRRRLLHLMSPDEVAALPNELVGVQLHTHRHRVPDDAVAFEQEIAENRTIIANLTSARAATHFCYPSGRYESAFLPWLKEGGVTTATTCRIQLADRTHNPLLLPRYVDTMYQSRLRFESWCSGAARLLPREDVIRIFGWDPEKEGY